MINLEFLKTFMSEESSNTGFDDDTKQKIFRNSSDRCERCGEKIFLNKHDDEDTGAWHAHHLKPKADNGDNTAANGAALCVACHKKVHASKEETKTFAKALLEKRKSKKG